MMSGDLFVTNLLKTVYCPVEHQLLTEAVNLFPCCHKINQAAAERMYGKSIAGECKLKGERCVICERNVTGYAPDQTVRTQAALILGNVKKLEDLFGQPLALGEIPEPMAFPGKSAIFNLTGHPHDCIFQERAIFDSEIKDSLIKEFIIMTKDNGEVGLTVRFTNGMNFEDYMRSCGIALWNGRISSGYDNTSYFHTSGSAQCQKLLRILTENNTIPSDCLDPLRKWVGAKKPMEAL